MRSKCINIHDPQSRVYELTDEYDGRRAIFINFFTLTPMNHSNKDGRSSAESEEGRPLIKENAGQPNTYPTQSGKGVSQGLASVVQRC